MQGRTKSESRRPLSGRSRSAPEGRTFLAALSDRWNSLKNDAVRANLPRLLLFFLAAVGAGAVLVHLAEAGQEDGMFRRLFDGIWWSVVTIASVGYGDKYPRTDVGRSFAILLILSGVVLTSLISGTIASIFVERRIREGKGLRDVKLKRHILVCGWNSNARNVLEGIAASGEAARTSVVLVSMMESDLFEDLKTRYPGLDLRFVRGDHTQEAVLRRASAGAAHACVLLPDETGPGGASNADERTIMACLAVKALNPEIHAGAEILKPESEQHLVRAQADDVIVNGEFSGRLLSAAGFEPGLPGAARKLFSGETRLRQSPIPSSLVGKTFREASGWYLSERSAVLIGVLSKGKGMALEDLLSDDSSAIDAFIKRKFQEAEMDLARETGAGDEIHLAPGPDYVIRDSDWAFTVG
ncbi:MAG: hypothetical protein GX430_05400 [Treponema sp.]|nr:hypothetical protein [Treponema sp.]